MLYVEDLVKAYEQAHEKIGQARGKIFNVGGGPQNTMSLLELLDFLEEFFGKKIPRTFAETRPGDQPVYVSDISKINRVLGWTPKTSVKEGVKVLAGWVAENPGLFAHL